jgi:hypothetical protein
VQDSERGRIPGAGAVLSVKSSCPVFLPCVIVITYSVARKPGRIGVSQEPMGDRRHPRVRSTLQKLPQ